MNVIPMFSTVLTLVFTIAVFRRYQQKKRTHLLIWTFGLLLYGLGTFSEVFMSLTFSELVLKVWYLAGAMLTAAWLGQGTIHLLVRKRGVARMLNVVLSLLSIVALGLIVMASITSAAASYDVTQAISSQYRDILERNGPIIFLTVVLNLYGTVTLVGGALYSAFLFWRKQVLAQRMFGNILIAAGALMPAMGGSFLKMGLADLLYISELIGVILMYAGFLVATAPEAEVERYRISDAGAAAD